MDKPTFIFVPAPLIDLDYQGPDAYVRLTVKRFLKKDDAPLYKQVFVETNEIEGKVFSWYLIAPFQTHFLFSDFGELLIDNGEVPIL